MTTATMKSIGQLIGIVLFALAVVALCVGAKQGDRQELEADQAFPCNNPDCKRNPANRHRAVSIAAKPCNSWACTVYRYPSWDDENTMIAQSDDSEE